MTDGRFSGATRGFMVGHVAPEAAVGGPIAAVREGDMITIDIEKRTIELEISPEEIDGPAERLESAGAEIHVRRVSEIREAGGFGRAGARSPD